MPSRKKIEDIFLQSATFDTKSLLQNALDNLVLGKCNLSLYLAPELAARLDETGKKLRAGISAARQPEFTDHVLIELILTAAIADYEEESEASLIAKATEEWEREDKTRAKVKQT